jgi:hypothetical protein
MSFPAFPPQRSRMGQKKVPPNPGQLPAVPPSGGEHVFRGGLPAGCGQTACCTSWMRCRERNSREKRSFSSGQRPWMDFGHGLPAGCGQTACCTSWMRCRERNSREKRSFSSGQRPWMDFGHGLPAGYRSRHGTEITHRPAGTGGMTRSTRWAAVAPAGRFDPQNADRHPAFGRGNAAERHRILPALRASHEQ